MDASNIISGTIYLASLLPDWNVLDSVRLAHSRLELWSIIFFGLLAFAEAIAHRTKDGVRKDRIDAVGIVFFCVAVALEGGAYIYGLRNDALSEGVISSLSNKAKLAGDTADAAKTEANGAKLVADSAKIAAGEANTTAGFAKRKSDSVLSVATKAAQEAAGALTAASDARSQAEKANNELADRTLSDFQVAILSGKLREFEGQQYEIVSYWDSRESLALANRIYASLQGALWKYDDSGQKAMLLGGVVGVQVWHHPSADESARKAAQLLIDELNANGITAYEKLQNPANPKSNEINISVGSKR